MSLRKVAGLLMAFGLVVGLIGAGVGANFTDSATAVANISVGTFGISVNAPGGVVTNSGHTVTFTCPAIQSSVAGTCPFSFTVSNTGSIPANVTVSSAITTLGAGPTAVAFTDMLVGGSTSHVAPYTYNGGLSWGVLNNDNLGETVTITYTISATA